MKKILQKIKASSTRYIAGAMGTAFVLGIIFWGGFNTALEVTNTEQFCLSCHEMRNFVYAEYVQTIHYSNRTGVRATCPDCHVPRDWGPKVLRKIMASNELLHKIMGSINTREKFEGKRLTLASHVWKSMKDTDSRECRNCHSIESMSLQKQSQLSSLKHERARQHNMTCIDCHMGIAHHLPSEFDNDGLLHQYFENSKRPCNDCHAAMSWANQ